MTIEWTNLSSGLLGAVIGSIAGFLGSLYLNWSNDKNNRRSAGRAVLAEIVMSQEAFKQSDDQARARRARQAPQFSRTVVQGQLSLVAKLLDWSELCAVLTPYVRAAEVVAQFDRANELDWQAQQSKGQGVSSYHQALAKQASEAREGAARALQEVCQGFENAAEVLGRKVLSDDELKKLRDSFANSAGQR
jgi:hypothetical protein